MRTPNLYYSIRSKISQVNPANFSRKLRQRKLFHSILALILIATSAFAISYLNNKQNPSSAYTPDDFVTTWEVYQDNHEVQIPVYKASILTGYNYTIDWGDGSPVETFTDNTVPRHVYPRVFPMTYQVTISGTFPGWTFEPSHTEAKVPQYYPGEYGYKSIDDKLISIDQWGTGNWLRMDNMFKKCAKLNGNYTDSPRTGLVTDFSGMFQGARQFNSPVNFDTSNATNMSSMFGGASSFNQPVAFITDNVTNFSNMFAGTSRFNQQVNFNTISATDLSRMFASSSFNQPVAFATDNVKDFSSMFEQATNFDQPINFNMASATNLSRMFAESEKFNQPINLSPTNATNFSEMFYRAKKFNSPVSLDLSSAINLSLMFAYSFEFNQPISFNSGNATDFSNMFAGAKKFNQSINLDTTSAKTMRRMFHFAEEFNQSLDSFNTSKVEDMSEMFAYSQKFNQPINFDTRSVVNFSSMFMAARAFNQPINFNTQEAKDMSHMFSNSGFYSPYQFLEGSSENSWVIFNSPINFSDTSKVEDMNSMFAGNKVFNQLVNFNTTSVKNMRGIFAYAENFNQPINFNTDSLVYAGFMFISAKKFNQSLSFSTSKVKDMEGMFARATSFNRPLSFDTSRVENMENMFMDASSFDQDLGNFNYSGLDFYLKHEPLKNFLSNTATSISNYDKIIRGLSRDLADLNGASLIHSPPVIGVDGLKYCTSEPSRNLVINRSYVFTGDNKDCSAYHIRDMGLSRDSFEENNTPNFNFANILLDSDITYAEYSFSLNCSTTYPDNSNFNIVLIGESLKPSLVFISSADYEVKNTYSICIKATYGIQDFEKNFTINILDVFESVISISLSGTNLNFNFQANETNSTKTLKTTANIQTNNPNGYTLSLYAQNSSSLRSTDPLNSNQIPTLSSAVTLAGLPNNSWGYSLDNINVSPIPSAVTTIFTESSIASRSVDTYYHVRPGPVLAGEYQSTMVYSVVVKP